MNNGILPLFHSSENVESENLRPEELNQQNIESLLSESNLVGLV